MHKLIILLLSLVSLSNSNRGSETYFNRASKLTQLNANKNKGKNYNPYIGKEHSLPMDSIITTRQPGPVNINLGHAVRQGIFPVNGMALLNQKQYII